MLNISNHGPRFAALFLLFPELVFVVSLFWHIGQAPAQVQTYYYQGPYFDNSTCTPNATHTCVGGSVSGSVTKDAGAVSSVTMTALGPPLGLGDDQGTVPSLTVTGGVVTAWAIHLFRWSSDPYNQIDAQGSVAGGVTSDDGFLQYNGPPLHVYEGVAAGQQGHWSNPKSFGIACNQAGGVRDRRTD